MNFLLCNVGVSRGMVDIQVPSSETKAAELHRRENLWLTRRWNRRANSTLILFFFVSYHTASQCMYISLAKVWCGNACVLLTERFNLVKAMVYAGIMCTFNKLIGFVYSVFRQLCMFVSPRSHMII